MTMWHHLQYGNSEGNVVQENSSILSIVWSTCCHQLWCVGSKTLLQQNPAVLNWGVN